VWLVAAKLVANRLPSTTAPLVAEPLVKKLLLIIYWACEINLVSLHMQNRRVETRLKKSLLAVATVSHIIRSSSGYKNA